MPKYIMGKDFHLHVGETILIPHPPDPNILPVKLKIVNAENKQVTMEMVGTILRQTSNYSKDKNKYLIVDEK